MADDEPLARMGMRKYISELPHLTLLGECRNGEEVLDFLKEKKPDLIFLDIQMPFKNGLEVIENLEYCPLVIITTAYSQYAVKGFELNVADYLVKPFSKERFKLAVDRVSELISLHALRDNEQIVIKSNRTLIKLNISDIVYLQAMENYVVFHTRSQKYVVHQTLSSAMEMLSGSDFHQVHKSFAVSRKHVQAIDREALLVNDKSIPVGKSFRKEMKSLFEK
ncbi:DNA-binding response regulator [Cytophagales bacterium WSM2-2]|nr:DNA-binding response regulator [Cytophagales bacterium WSM2-2]